MSSPTDPLRTATDQQEYTNGEAGENPIHNPPPRIGRYRIERILGQGSFGRVYLAFDDQLQRPVTVKVPHRGLVCRVEDVEAYLSEARTVAILDHPNIVPVYDVGSSADCPFFIVSKFIEGRTLAERIKTNRLSLEEAATLTATVCEALHHAHKQGIIHRDIKPGNILLDKNGKPYVADFGLALREQDVGTGPHFAGTPPYMSPEQARGEGHRVDGRSDIFSLGIVFYELLTGRRPFQAESQKKLLEEIASLDPSSPRQIDNDIPKELDRICLKALAKRASERYSLAADMADDLRKFLMEASAAATRAPTLKGVSASEIHPVAVVPKGLRSFDACDADFFLELLPGPRDREGLPESIRFWKSRIESRTPATFSAGLIYGPSGCGKSSLVKAGLLPRLARSVATVYVEATDEETEARLLRGLRVVAPNLPSRLGVVDSLAALRRGQFFPSAQKILLVLDQFEQWLLTKRSEGNAELMQALRHCDGKRLQCLILVRDDFWLAVSRFMQALEVRIVEGENSRLVDLFDLRHARAVLLAFGTALGALPETGRSKEQDAFLDRAVAGLAQEGKVISVRLALFAEMVKGKPWIPATLREIGGAEGVGVTFLDETFTASTSPPRHRLHQRAAQAVLTALLPEAGTDIKGQMRSRHELLEASGYANRAEDFAELLRILDSELRLLTPIDPEGKRGPSEPDGASTGSSGRQYYQLTHDYLIPSLRDWLTRKQKETWRGRTEQVLADRAAVWNGRPENRQLPTLGQWLQIQCLTAKSRWTAPQRKMMRKASRYHALRGFALALLLFLLGWGAYESHGRFQAHALRERLLDAHTHEVPTIVRDIAGYRRWLDPLLYDAQAQAVQTLNQRELLHTSLALLPVDASQVNYLYARMIDAEPDEVAVIREFLALHKEQLVGRLWAVVQTPETGKERRRLRAAAALALYDADSEKWTQAQEAVVNDLVGVHAVHLAMWIDLLRPVRSKLLPQLLAVYRDAARREAERSLATEILADYAADQPRLLAQLLLDADDKEFLVIYAKFEDHGEAGLPLLNEEIEKKLSPQLPSADARRENLAKCQANAAAALLKMNQPGRVWPFLKHSPDPRVRSYLIHRLGPLVDDAESIVERFEEERDITIRRALILSLGEQGEEALSPPLRKIFVPRLQDLYREEPDAGLHAAAEWLLRTWRQETRLKEVNSRWAKGKEEREKRLDRIRRQIEANGPASWSEVPPQWYVNGQGQTMVVIPGPVEFTMGSPPTEADRDEDEGQQRVRIERTFALAAKSVTVEQYRRFDNNYQLPAAYTRTAELPVVATSWHQAAAYCNWLSKEEGIDENQWCYEIKDGQVTRMMPNYLSRSGYRLPTEAEIEYATRAGATTSRYYGETEELLSKYAWYTKNSQGKTWPVGSLKPNDFGLFDMQGNVYTWCQDRYEDHPPGREGEIKKDTEDTSPFKNQDSRVMRGGSFSYPTWIVRSAYRNRDVPSYRGKFIGVRPARTIRASP